MRNIRVERNGKKLTNEDINYISRMAKSGHTHEQYTLGLVYYYGQGPDVDMEEAKKWLRMAAEKGHSEAQYVLGEIHLREDSAEDIEGAIYWLELASKDANLKIAKELLLKQAYLRYVIIYLMGCTIPNEKTGITEDLHDLALRIRMHLMIRDYKSSIEGMRFFHGKTKDRKLNEYVNRSLIYLTEINKFVGNKDDSGTIQPWGNILVNKETGEIIAKSKEKLFVNKDKAGIVVDASDIRSEQKNPTTIPGDELASYSEENYRKGLESLTKKDYVKAGKYFFLAAKSGNIKAKYVYGKMLLYGTGVKKNIDEGIRLLQISSDKGYAKSATTLGEMYEKGKLIQRDFKKAEDLYQRAAELGDEKALQRINNSRKEEHKQVSEKSKGRPSRTTDSTMPYVVIPRVLENRRFIRSTEFYRNLLYKMKGFEMIMDDPKNHLFLGDLEVAAITAPYFDPKPGFGHVFRFDAGLCKQALKHYLSAGFGLRSKILLDRHKGILEQMGVMDYKLSGIINSMVPESHGGFLSVSRRNTAINPFISMDDPCGLICIEIVLLTPITAEEEKNLKKKNGLFYRLAKYGLKDFESNVYKIYADYNSKEGKSIIDSVIELPAEFLVMIRQTTLTNFQDISTEHKIFVSRLIEPPQGQISKAEIVNGLKKFPLDPIVLMCSVVDLSRITADTEDPQIILMVAYVAGMLFLLNNDNYYTEARNIIESLLAKYEFEYAADDLSDIGDFIGEENENMLNAIVTRNAFGKTYIGGDSDDEE